MAQPINPPINFQQLKATPKAYQKVNYDHESSLESYARPRGYEVEHQPPRSNIESEVFNFSKVFNFFTQFVYQCLQEKETKKATYHTIKGRQYLREPLDTCST
jgi:hypothetical protein